MIYFDNSATTAIHPAALDTYVKVSQQIMGNPSSLHRLGEQARSLLEQARSQIADLLDVKAEEIYFTSGGTEGNNWVIKGTAIEKKAFGHRHIILSEVEHPAVRQTALQLQQAGFSISWLPVDQSGRVDPTQLKELIRKETILVSVMAVNNEVGTIQPIRELGAILEAYPAIHFHVDAVQAIGQVPIQQWLTPRVDFATFSAHKFHGPRGAGFIYWKKGRRIAPLLNGGGQEQGQRSGTENLPAIAAMAKALRLTMETAAKTMQAERLIQTYLADTLARFSQVVLFSETNNNFAPHILCFALRGMKGEALVHALEEQDIYLSTTSACSSRSKAQSSTLQAMQVTPQVAECAVRLSLGAGNTLSEAEEFVFQFNQLYQHYARLHA